MIALQTKADFDFLCKETDFTERFRRIMARIYAHAEPDPQDVEIADSVRDRGWELVHNAQARGITRGEAGEIMNVLTRPLCEVQQRKAGAVPV